MGDGHRRDQQRNGRTSTYGNDVKMTLRVLTAQLPDAGLRGTGDLEKDGSCVTDCTMAGATYGNVVKILRVLTAQCQTPAYGRDDRYRTEAKPMVLMAQLPDSDLRLRG